MIELKKLMRYNITEFIEWQGAQNPKALQQQWKENQGLRLLREIFSPDQLNSKCMNDPTTSSYYPPYNCILYQNDLEYVSK